MYSCFLHFDQDLLPSLYQSHMTTSVKRGFPREKPGFSAIETRERDWTDLHRKVSFTAFPPRDILNLVINLPNVPFSSLITQKVRCLKGTRTEIRIPKSNAFPTFLRLFS